MRRASCNAMGGASSAPTMTAAWTTPGAPASRFESRKQIVDAMKNGPRHGHPGAPSVRKNQQPRWNTNCPAMVAGANDAKTTHLPPARHPDATSPREVVLPIVRPAKPLAPAFGQAAERPVPFRSCLAEFLSVAGHGGYRPASSAPRSRRSVTRRASACR
jgi:hypothetical protein